VRTRPWWDAQYFIPMLGMLLGSCVSAVSVGLTNLLSEVTNGALATGCTCSLLGVTAKSAAAVSHMLKAPQDSLR